MFFNSVKEIKRLRKEISKGMSNIYLKVNIEKKWRFQNFDFLKLKNWSQGADIIKFSNFLLQLKNQREQNCVWLFHYFNFERNYDGLKSKNPCILLNKNINFN